MIHQIFALFLINALQATKIEAWHESSQLSEPMNNHHQIIKTSDFPNKVDLTGQCESYSDCYNCTLAKCSYDNGKCSDNGHKGEIKLTIETFLKNGQKCGDAQGLCSQEWKENRTQTNIRFVKHKEIPANYFCIQSIFDHKLLDPRFVAQLYSMHFKVSKTPRGGLKEHVFYYSESQKKDTFLNPIKQYKSLDYVSKKFLARHPRFSEFTSHIHDAVALQVGFINSGSSRVFLEKEFGIIAGAEIIIPNPITLFVEKHWYIILMSSIITFAIGYCFYDCINIKKHRRQGSINEANLLKMDDKILFQMEDTIYTQGTRQNSYQQKESQM